MFRFIGDENHIVQLTFLEFDLQQPRPTRYGNVHIEQYTITHAVRRRTDTDPAWPERQCETLANLENNVYVAVFTRSFNRVSHRQTQLNCDVKPAQDSLREVSQGSLKGLPEDLSELAGGACKSKFDRITRMIFETLTHTVGVKFKAAYAVLVHLTQLSVMVQQLL
jgi:hypothetical protein